MMFWNLCQTNASACFSLLSSPHVLLCPASLRDKAHLGFLARIKKYIRATEARVRAAWVPKSCLCCCLCHIPLPQVSFACLSFAWPFDYALYSLFQHSLMCLCRSYTCHQLGCFCVFIWPLTYYCLYPCALGLTYLVLEFHLISSLNWPVQYLLNRTVLSSLGNLMFKLLFIIWLLNTKTVHFIGVFAWYMTILLPID